MTGPTAEDPGSRSIGNFRAVPAGGRHRRSSPGSDRPLSHRVLLLGGIVAVALNLRTAVTSLGAVLGEVTGAWGFSGLLAGLLTSLPVAVFAVVGFGAPALARRLGPERSVAAAMLVAAAGLALRALTGSAALFLAGSALALSGAAVGNVLMPTLVKRYFPERTGSITALYTTALALGMTGAAALTGPAERAFGGDWRVGLGLWAGLALVAAPPWLALAGLTGPRGGGTVTGPRGGGTVTGPRGGGMVTGPGRVVLPSLLLRSRMARALTLYFGCQSLNAYVVLGWLPSVLVGAGQDPHAASLPLALVSAMTVPMSIALPALAVRRMEQRGLVVLTSACYLGGYLGLLWVPAVTGWPAAATGLIWLSAALLGAGNGAFPLAVTLIGLRTRRPEVTTALSALVQSGGYLLAAAGPLAVGILHQLSGGWRLPLLALLATLLPQLLSGLRAAGPGTVESEPEHAPRR
ncbi:MAG TPA: MFS transporter [Pseudonocardia sp.]|uniref:MFS transporter n=1 Tax=Pseudonocardia sp. TaxID=60912 RepID=UPI002ED86FD6